MTATKDKVAEAVDWEKIAKDSLEAVRAMSAHYDDLGKSNPGFMGKLTLQDYGLWNEALIKTRVVVTKYAHIEVEGGE